MGDPAGDITIRTELRPGDIGYALYRHGELYARENGYGRLFELYVGRGLCEFLERYEPERDRVWAAELGGRMVGFLLLMHRGEEAQLRYFLIEPELRGRGLGRKLLGLALGFARERGYRGVYLWTTAEQEGAIALYESFGFALAEEKSSSTFGAPQLERRYALELGRPG
jgi:N-acetylglutamate synthase-like GNAT family acetyltransferase